MTRRTFLRQSGLFGGAFLTGTPFLLSNLTYRAQPISRVERIYMTMGTTVRYLVFHEDEREALAGIHEAQRLVRRVHNLMSIQEQESELTRWNQSLPGEDVSFDPLTTQALDEAFRYRHVTEGRFDPTVGTTVATGSLCSWHVEDRRLLKEHSDIRLDLGGSAKGLAVDRATDILLRRGVSAALVNAGGDLRVIGHPPDLATWPIGIRNPLEPDTVLCELRLNDCAVATSGGYESERSTIVDPRDGQVASFEGSATVIAPSCGAADCLSTALCVEPEAGFLPEHAHALIGRSVGATQDVEPSPGFPTQLLVSRE